MPRQLRSHRLQPVVHCAGPWRVVPSRCRQRAAVHLLLRDAPSSVSHERRAAHKGDTKLRSASDLRNACAVRVAEQSAYGAPEPAAQHGSDSTADSGAYQSSDCDAQPRAQRHIAEP